MLYNLKYKDIEIVINSKGAEQEHLFYKGKDYMRVRDEFWNRKAPFLFPIVGKLRDLKTNINGKEYSMGQHGIVRDLEFNLVEQGKNYILLDLKYNEDTLKQYPFCFHLFVKYTIEGNGVNVELEVKNEGKDEMFFNIGGHPGFRLPMFEGEKFEDYRIVLGKKFSWDAPTVSSNGTLNFIDTVRYNDVDTINLNYKYFEIDAIVMPNIPVNSVLLVNKENKGIKFSYDGFNTLAVWTRPNAPYVCLEPWRGYADHSDSNYDFVSKDDIVKLNANETKKFSYTVDIIL